MSMFKPHKNKYLIRRVTLGLLIVAAFLFVLGVGIYGWRVSPDYDYFSSNAKEYDYDWYWEREDGSVLSFKVPYRLPISDGEPATVYTILPDDIPQGTYICFIVGRNFTVYVNDELRYYHDSEVSERLGGVVKALYIPIPLGPEDSGAKLTLFKNNPDGRNGGYNNVLIGDMNGIRQYVWNQYSTLIAYAFILAILSVITSVVFLILSIINKKILPLVYLSLGILVCSLWAIVDDYLFQFLTNKYYVDGVVGYMLTLLMAIPFCLYMNNIQNYRYEKIYHALEGISVANFAVLTVLHFGTSFRYDSALLYIDIMLLLAVFVIVILSVIDFVKHKESRSEHLFVRIGMIVLFVCGIFEIIVINIYVNRNYMVGGLFVIFGLYVLLGCAVLDQVKKLQEIRLISQEAIASTKAKSEFLANMSHEIRTPINAIIGMNEMILRETKDDNIKDYAGNVYAASQNLLGIINDILDFSKIESGKMEIESSEYNLRDLLATVSSMIEIKAKQKGLKFRVEVLDELPSVLYGDSKRISEIMINILTNAVKYTHRGFIVFNISGKVKEDGDFYLEFFVRDTGIGIKEEDLEKLFGTFERLEYKRNRNIEGSGLGLAITEKLLQMMDGTIVVDSLYGSGSRFSVSIPQKIVDNIPIGKFDYQKKIITDDKAWGTFEAPECSVLVVDDNNMNLLVIQNLLKATRMRVDTVQSGKEMLSRIGNISYDIIFLDHMMPVMDGIEALRIFKATENNMSKNAVMVALTSNAIVGAKEMYIDAGFDYYLSKPVDVLEMEDLLKRCLPEDKIIARGE